MANFNRLHAIRRSAKKHSKQKQARLTASQLRDLVCARFGKKCKRCGFEDIRALQIDHIKGGGSKESRLIGQSGIYKKILSGKHDADYQLLCANCNWIKRLEEKEHTSGEHTDP